MCKQNTGTHFCIKIALFTCMGISTVKTRPRQWWVNTGIFCCSVLEVHESEPSYIGGQTQNCGNFIAGVDAILRLAINVIYLTTAVAQNGKSQDDEARLHMEMSPCLFNFFFRYVWKLQGKRIVSVLDGARFIIEIFCNQYMENGIILRFSHVENGTYSNRMGNNTQG